MSNWADETRCQHGITFNDECERCEMVGIEESLSWMKRRVALNEKRLSELQEKLTLEIQVSNAKDELLRIKAIAKADGEIYGICERGIGDMK